MEWYDYFGGLYDDGGHSLIQTSDGGLAIAGYKSGPIGSAMYLVKTGSLPQYYSVDIWAWDAMDPNGWISEPVIMDGTSGYNTGHFAGLSGTHTFTVPTIDVDGRGFSDWYTGETTTTITITHGGIYTARYGLSIAITGITVTSGGSGYTTPQSSWLAVEEQAQQQPHV